jgi:cyclophilin family peptidyl-prolyl cis-trans isomerase
MRGKLTFLAAVVALLSSVLHARPASGTARETSLTALSSRRAVLQTDFGDIHIGFYENAAPKTVKLVTKLLEMVRSSSLSPVSPVSFVPLSSSLCQGLFSLALPFLSVPLSHIRTSLSPFLSLVCMHFYSFRIITQGLYNSNHIFRVDKGFVAQVADVENGRLFKNMNERQAELARQRVPLEVQPELKHDRAGLLSLARHDDPNSGGSSFSLMLGAAPHLDMNYAIFGEVVSPLDPLRDMEQVETVTEGIFVMPKDRITIHSSYLYDDDNAGYGLDKVQEPTVANRTASKGMNIADGVTHSCGADVVAALQTVREKLSPAT